MRIYLFFDKDDEHVTCRVNILCIEMCCITHLIVMFVIFYNSLTLRHYKHNFKTNSNNTWHANDITKKDMFFRKSLIYYRRFSVQTFNIAIFYSLHIYGYLKC